VILDLSVISTKFPLLKNLKSTHDDDVPLDLKVKKISMNCTTG
jgi:hypothetical protein